ncbi:MAG: hypothetical protein F4Y98_05680 [Chloroflexi bacterium]|nr:hypothetical protein [Chloroflexota bacterium]
MLRPDGEAASLRAGLLLLVVLGVVGTALALAFDRHWQSPWQMAPWVTLGAICVAWIALVLRPTASTVWLVRAVAVLTIVVAALGVWQHAEANYDAGPTGHDHATDHGTTSADGADSEDDDASSDGHDHDHDHDHDDASSDGHHDDEDASSDGHHHDDEDAAGTATGSDTTEMASSDVTFMDAMTGSAGHAPVPAALAIVPVGLALALATIGIGGRHRLSDD